ncbi:hypothetical protein TBK1r_48530 [Stieleria magnilauensis]|uniref:Uncharacterized protein n=1 Tax=Stieleria magnilauensis TaxID=2527963 RepID=A0ABX5XV22_9BACT|nr:hypothetical protein TBK1r_48530 [Planctomycetes bacterium TBK1r]
MMLAIASLACDSQIGVLKSIESLSPLPGKMWVEQLRHGFLQKWEETHRATAPVNAGR